MKICNKCHVEKPVDAFNRDSSRPNGFRYSCRKCDSIGAASYCEKNKDIIKAAVRERHLANPKKRQERNNKSALKIKYGLTVADRDSLLNDQNGGCAICGNTFTKTPCVDHCHKTGKVRGLLCGPCNTAIGLLGDSFSTVMKAANYLFKSS